MISSRKKSLVFFVCLLSFAILFENRALAKERSTSEKIQSYLIKNKINGMVLMGKTKKPKIVNNNIYLRGPYQITQNKYFPIASLQKLLTGMAIYRLEKSGYFKWDEPVKKILPVLNLSSKVTVRMLMTHTSGLIDNYPKIKSPIYTEGERVNYGLSNYKKGVIGKWNYASSNYAILSYLIMQEAHESYYSYVRSMIGNNLREDIKPFNLVNYKEIVLQPVLGAGKRDNFISVIEKTSLVSNPTLYDKVNWFNLSKDISKTYGAGDMLATPKSYWIFITNYLLKNKEMIREWRSLTIDKAPSYFGGIYMKKKYIYAAGTVNKYTCCFFVTDCQTNKTIMFFSNNTNHLKLEKVVSELKKIYFN